MKYRIEINELKGYDGDETIFISDPIEDLELFAEILSVLLKPSIFGNTNCYRICILPEDA